MDDLISRQAAIDMASTIQTDDSSGNEILDVVEVDDIKALPSAQPEIIPEIIYCKDCQHWDKCSTPRVPDEKEYHYCPMEDLQYCLEHDESMIFSYKGKRYRLSVTEIKAESEDKE